MFEVAPEFTTESYLRYAFQQPDGQFSHNKHLVALTEGQVAGITCCWSDTMSVECRYATMESLINFFGHQHIPEIAKRSVLLQSIIPTPSKHALGLGHLAVVPQYKRRGVGSALVNHVLAQAKEAGKEALELDVECDNSAALSLYQRMGFEIANTTQPGPAAKELGFTAHHHMVKRC